MRQEQLQIYQKLLTDQKITFISNLSMFHDFGGWFEPGLTPYFLVYRYVITIFNARPFYSQISYWIYILFSEKWNWRKFVYDYVRNSNNKVSKVLLLVKVRVQYICTFFSELKTAKHYTLLSAPRWLVWFWAESVEANFGLKKSSALSKKEQL